MKKTFKEIAYTFYPKDIHEFESQYHISNEHKNLCSKLNDPHTYEYIDKLSNEIEKEITPFKIEKFLHGSNNLSYLIQVNLNENETISIYFSFLIPYYHVVMLKGIIEERKIDHSYSSKWNNKAISKIKMIIQHNSNYAEFPKRLISQNIPNILVREKFTYLNAFFTDYYRIKNF